MSSTSDGYMVSREVEITLGISGVGKKWVFAIARFAGKCFPDFHHKDLLKGFAISNNEPKSFKCKLYNLKRGRTDDCRDDIRIMIRIILVIGGKMSANLLLSNESLMCGLVFEWGRRWEVSTRIPRLCQQCCSL